MKKLLVLAAAFAALGALPAHAQVLGSDAGVSKAVAVQNAAYSSGNALGNLTTLSLFRTDANPGGIINSFAIQSKGGSTPTITVYAFDANPTATTCTDKSAFSMGAADRPHLIGGAPFTLTLATVGTGDTATYAIDQSMGLQVRNQDATPTANIYVCLVTGTAFTPASTSDITIKVGVSQN